MDPVSVIGLASGILTFVEAGLKLVKIAYNIHKPRDGVLDDNRYRESVTSKASKASKAALSLEANAKAESIEGLESQLKDYCKTHQRQSQKRRPND
ncbi:Uncharacterized protein LW93_3158 [Fusarium fujikuroi]|nr:Uncharacterized protein LW93_3158 [Fusarium fujikuroi]